MKLANSSILQITKVFCLWLLLFLSFRIFFLVKFTNLDLEAISGLLAGWRLDLSVSGYLTIPFCLFILLELLFNHWTHTLKVLSKSYIALVVFLIILIEYSSIQLYEEWGTTLNSRAFEFLKEGQEVNHTISNYLSIGLLLILVMAILFLKGALNIIQFPKVGFTWKGVISMLVVMFFLLIIGRGGIGKIPIQIADSFYSSNTDNNFLAINKVFYLLDSFKKRDQLIVDHDPISRSELSDLESYFYPDTETGRRVLQSHVPNIVIIGLEGALANVFLHYGGNSRITPNMNELIKNGLLFENIYSSGFRTDQGILSLLSGVPAVPHVSLMNELDRPQKLPSLIRSIANYGYTTSFHYGGDLNFSNFRRYFKENQTHVLVGKSSFSISDQQIDWGVPDGILLNKVVADYSSMKQPFFGMVMTQSSHPPFDLTVPNFFPGEDNHSKFLSSIHYTDSCIGNFISQAQDEEWYSNTLFVLVADHGSVYLNDIDFNDHNRFRIPLLFFGPALNEEWIGKVISKIGNHHDLPSTLLNQLDIDSDDFPLSKDLLNSESKDFAFWILEHSLGWIKADQKIVFGHESNKIYLKENNSVDFRPLMEEGMNYYRLSAQTTLDKIYGRKD